MFVSNYQPITLIDYPNHLATIAYIFGCPLRCPFCHNPELVIPSLKSNKNRLDDFIKYFIQRKDLLDGVVLSGGEPLMERDLVLLIEKIKKAGLKAKIDTSGLFHQKLERIIDLGLVDYVALDYKNTKSLANKTCGIEKNYNQGYYFDRWRASLEVLRKSNIQYELRTTVVKEFHTLETLLEMASVLDETENWYIQSFQRTTRILSNYDVKANNTVTLSSYTPIEIEYVLDKLRKTHANTILR